jgi:hypothetical protein
MIHYARVSYSTALLIVFESKEDGSEADYMIILLCFFAIR